MNYQPLLSLELQHDYYADGLCPDFEIVPALRTQQLLANYRCVLRPYLYGLRVLTQVLPDNRAFISLPATLELEFELRLTNPDFVLFTDLSGALREGALLVNQQGSSELSVAPAANADNADNTDNTANTATSPGNGVFARVRVTLGGADTVLPQPDWQCQLRFQAKQCRWKYYVLLNKPSQGSNAAATAPIILDSASRIVFAPADARDLSQNPDASDQLAQQLARQYPDLQRWRLRSKSLVACRQAPPATLQLQLNGEKVLDALPAPPPQNFVVDVTDANTEDGLYYTLKYFTR